ncbi:MAG: glycosyltransferase family 61 protein, partial [Planctomycetia bacterium]|nr:glycosyltransferase family 61 protein [Planctomycetia bacterium]
EEAGITAETRFYVPVDKPFQRESLRLLGIAADRIVPARPQTHLQADRLLVSSVRDQQLSPEDCDFLHRRLTGQLATELPADQRIVIMRRRAGRRSIVNQRALLQALTPLGFKPVWLERLPLAEQIELFYRAECVVGPHGAGLSNLLFCRPGAVAVEVGTPYRVLPCFAEIAQHRGLHHHLELATPVNLRQFDPVEGVGDSDLRVDPAAIRGRVEHLLASQEIGRRLAA